MGRRKILMHQLPSSAIDDSLINGLGVRGIMQKTTTDELMNQKETLMQSSGDLVKQSVFDDSLMAVTRRLTRILSLFAMLFQLGNVMADEDNLVIPSVYLDNTNEMRDQVKAEVGVLENLFAIHTEYQCSMDTTSFTLDDFKLAVSKAVLEWKPAMGSFASNTSLDNTIIIKNLIYHLVKSDYNVIVRSLGTTRDGDVATSLLFLLYDLVAINSKYRCVLSKRQELEDTCYLNTILQWAYGTSSCSKEKIAKFFKNLRAIHEEDWNGDGIRKILFAIRNRFPNWTCTVFHKGYDTSIDLFSNDNVADESSFWSAFDKLRSRITHGWTLRIVTLGISNDNERRPFVEHFEEGGLDSIVFLEIMRKLGVREIGFKDRNTSSTISTRYLLGKCYSDDILVETVRTEPMTHNGAHLSSLNSFLLTKTAKIRLTRYSTITPSVKTSIVDRSRRQRIVVEYPTFEALFNEESTIRDIAAVSANTCMVVEDFVLEKSRDSFKKVCKLNSVQNLGFYLQIRWTNYEKLLYYISVFDTKIHEVLEPESLSWLKVSIIRKRDKKNELDMVTCIFTCLCDESRRRLDASELETKEAGALGALRDTLGRIASKNRLQNAFVATYEGRHVCYLWRQIHEFYLHIQECAGEDPESHSYFFRSRHLDASVVTFMASGRPRVIVFDDVTFSDDFFVSLRNKKEQIFDCDKLERIEVFCSKVGTTDASGYKFCNAKCSCLRLVGELSALKKDRVFEIYYKGAKLEDVSMVQRVVGMISIQ